MQEKLVSIVLPVYNGAENLRESIESVLKQTYKKFELIVVNDCSTDDTELVVKEYQKKDSRIRLLNNEVNLKLPNSLNRGFESALGEYWTWTSDDNIFLENAIERMVEVLENNHTDMVYTDYQKIDAEGNILEENCAEELKWICCTNPIGACFLYTREIAQKVGGYNPDMFLAEDYDYWIRIFRTGKIFFLKESLYQYRVHAGSLSSTRKEAINMQTYKVIERNFIILYEYAKQNGLQFIFFEVLERRLGENTPKELTKMRKQLVPSYHLYCAKRRYKERWSIIKGKISSKLRR